MINRRRLLYQSNLGFWRSCLFNGAKVDFAHDVSSLSDARWRVGVDVARLTVKMGVRLPLVRRS